MSRAQLRPMGHNGIAVSRGGQPLRPVLAFTAALLLLLTLASLARSRTSITDHQTGCNMTVMDALGSALSDSTAKNPAEVLGAVVTGAGGDAISPSNAYQLAPHLQEQSRCEGITMPDANGSYQLSRAGAHGFRIFIGHNFAPKVTLQAIRFFAASGLAPFLVVIGGSLNADIASSTEARSLCAEIVVPGARLSMSQTQELIRRIAVRREYYFYFGSHADIVMLPPVGTGWPSRLVRLQDAAAARDAAWGLATHPIHYLLATAQHVLELKRTQSEDWGGILYLVCVCATLLPG